MSRAMCLSTACLSHKNLIFPHMRVGLWKCTVSYILQNNNSIIKVMMTDDKTAQHYWPSNSVDKEIIKDHKEMPTLLRFVQKYDKNCFCFWPQTWDWVWRNRPTVTCFWSAVLTWWSVTAFFLLSPSVSVVFVSSAFFLPLFFFPKPLQRQ